MVNFLPFLSILLFSSTLASAFNLSSPDKSCKVTIEISPSSQIMLSLKRNNIQVLKQWQESVDAEQPH